MVSLSNAKYLNLETFRKTGVGVRTPVWFAQDPPPADGSEPVGRRQPPLYVYSAPDAGKVKRIRNNPHVRVAPCTIRGRIVGNWLEGEARICSPQEAAHGQELLRRKYGVLKRIGDFFSGLRGRTQPVIAIELK